MQEGAPKTEGKFEKSPLHKRLQKTAGLLGIAAAGYTAMPEGQATAETHDVDREGYEEVQEGEVSNAEQVKEAITALDQLAERAGEIDRGFIKRGLFEDPEALQKQIAEAEEFVQTALPEANKLTEEIGMTLHEMNRTEELSLLMGSGESPILDAKIARDGFESTLSELQSTLQYVSAELAQIQEGGEQVTQSESPSAEVSYNQTEDINIEKLIDSFEVDIAKEAGVEALDNADPVIRSVEENLEEQKALATVYIRNAQGALDRYSELLPQVLESGHDKMIDRTRANVETAKEKIAEHIERLQSLISEQERLYMELVHNDAIDEIVAKYPQLGQPHPEALKYLENKAE